MQKTIRKLTVVQPPLEGGRRHKRIMPLGVGYILACVRRCFPDIELVFIDLHSTNSNLAVGREQLRRQRPDMVLFSFWTPMAEYAYTLMRDARADLGSAAVLVAGGVHPTIFPEEALQHCDIVVCFEGEETVPEIITALRNGTPLNTVAGIWYREEGVCKTTAPREPLADLNKLPFPAWDLMPMAAYDTPMHIVGGPRVPVIGSRGCPYACSYCVSPFFWQRKIRWRHPAGVVDEIVALRQQLGIDNIHFWDDNMLMDREYVAGLCRELIERAPGVKWIGLTRASHLISCRELLPLIKQSGCIGIEMGIESADPESHKAVQKEERLEMTLAAAALLKEHGIMPLFTYMALNPGDTLMTYYRQAEFIETILAGCEWIDHFQHMPVPLYVGQLCTPHPGTKLYDDAPSLGVVNARRWTDYYHHRVNFIPDSLLAERPVRQTGRLTEKVLLLCLMAQRFSVYRFIGPDDSHLTKAGKAALLLQATQRMYRLCDGEHTLREIALALQRGLNLSDDYLWNCVGVQAVVLAQLGLLQPAGAAPRPQRDIDISGFGDTGRLLRLTRWVNLAKNILVPLYYGRGRKEL